MRISNYLPPGRPASHWVDRVMFCRLCRISPASVTNNHHLIEYIIKTQHKMFKRGLFVFLLTFPYSEFDVCNMLQKLEQCNKIQRKEKDLSDELTLTTNTSSVMEKSSEP